MAMVEHTRDVLAPLVELPAEVANVDLRCHILLTEPNREFKARDHLRDVQGFDPYVPGEPYVAHRIIHTAFGTQHRRVEGVRPIFRGYLFLPLNVAWSFGPIYRTPGLRQSPFMIHNGTHAVLPDYEVEKFRKLEYGLANPEQPILPYKVGDKVRIVEGPFIDMIAVVNRLDSEKRIELLMDILGQREVKFFAEAFQLERVH